eukprot:CAMPEP_0197599672 /NCGR_PEP_ID=MMETSP1326-20131121/31857_1 /TAXON_ID=1155430 /ORGANISM="Genus nov. species nov., Strain RCC2288" /LENGTH=68 /DNA_ID=CAMNT_0043166681 /DNA_START=33 /DNA_END=235 /DNA_ORIENTATION=+
MASADELPDTPGLKKLKVAELKELLEARGLDSAGKKDDLVVRLDASRMDAAADAADAEPSPAAAAAAA